MSEQIFLRFQIFSFRDVLEELSRVLEDRSPLRGTYMRGVEDTCDVLRQKEVKKVTLRDKRV